MTDREPAAPPPAAPRPAAPGPEPGPAPDPAPDPAAALAPPAPAGPGSTTPEREADGPGGTAVRDRWWWSPTLAIVVGLVVIGYQLEALRGPDPLWLNWVVAALGLASAVYGSVGLLRAYRSR